MYPRQKYVYGFIFAALYCVALPHIVGAMPVLMAVNPVPIIVAAVMLYWFLKIWRYKSAYDRINNKDR